MPKFSVNDKVSFINEKQDGIVRSIKTDGVYIVEIEDGFPIEVLESELVLIRQESKKQEIPEKNKEVKTAHKFIENIPSITSGIWLVSCPSVSGMVSTGPADIYLVNNSEYEIPFSCSFMKQNICTGIVAGHLHSGEEKRITTIRREEAFDLGDLYVEMIFFRKGIYILPPVIKMQTQLQFPDLAFASGRLPAPYAFCRVQLLSNPRTTEPDAEDLFSEYTAKDLQDKLMQPQPKQPKQKKARQDFAIDLHIEALTENFTGMSSSEIVNHQLAVFRKKLDEAMMSRQFTITFIHGAGNGILRSAIRKELSDLKLHYEDASYELYGGGATTVRLT